jgi:hypothetical protein
LSFGFLAGTLLVQVGGMAKLRRLNDRCVKLRKESDGSVKKRSAHPLTRDEFTSLEF